MKSAFVQRGFDQTGSGRGGNLKTGVYAESLQFSKPTEPAARSLQVTVSFQSAGSQRTLVEYWVTDLVLPPRPPSSRVEGTVSRIEVAITHNGKTAPSRTLTSPSAISRIVAAVNALSLISPPGVQSGGPDIHNEEVATLRMVQSDGKTITVKAGQVNQQNYTVTVDSVPLQDPKGTVWHAIRAAIAQSP